MDIIDIVKYLIMERSRIIRNIQKTRKDFNFTKDIDVLQFIEWRSESFFKDVFLLQLIPDDLKENMKPADAKKRIEDLKNYCKKEIYFCGFRHNCTSYIANGINIWKAEMFVKILELIEPLKYKGV